MKRFPAYLVRLCCCLALPIAALSFSDVEGAVNIPNRQMKIAFVNFKKAVENSKMGKQEQTTFDMIKKQMESSLEEKEQVFKEKKKPYDDLVAKLQDENYIDSLTPEAQKQMEHKLEELTRELTQMQMQVQELQQQYYQALQQANVKILQKLADTVSKASEKVAQLNKLDVIINDESTFYFISELDVTDEVVKEMDALHERELNELMNKPSAPNNSNSPSLKNW